MAAIAARQRGSRFVYLFAVLILMAIGAALASAVVWLLSLAGLNFAAVEQLGVVVGMWGGWIAYVQLAARFWCGNSVVVCPSAALTYDFCSPCRLQTTP